MGGQHADVADGLPPGPRPAGHGQPHRERRRAGDPRLAVDRADQPVHLPELPVDVEHRVGVVVGEGGRDRAEGLRAGTRDRLAGWRISMVSSCMAASCHARDAVRGWAAPGRRSGPRRTGRPSPRRARRWSGSSSGRAGGPGRPARPRRSAPRHGRARRRPDSVRRDERLDARVLGVVEPRPALARALRPLPRDEVGHGRADGARDLLDPRAGVGEVVARHDRDPDLDAALAGRLGIAADAEVPERRPVEPREDERLLPGRLLARVDVDVGERRLPRVRAGARSRRGSRSSPGCRASTASPTRSAMRWSLASRSSRPSTPVSCQRVSHVGAVAGMSFCQKPGAPAPFGNRWRLSGRSARCGSIVGAIRAK